MRVLIVEDSQDQRELYAAILTAQGLRVTLAGDGEEGLEKASQHRPDVIIVDLSLPGVSGWEATRRLRANEKTKHIPIIVLTAHSFVTAEAVGCEGCLIKPCLPVHLFAEILRVVPGVQNARRTHTSLNPEGKQP